MGTTEQIRAGALWLSTLGGGVGGLTYSTVADGGCESATWSMALPRTFSHPNLQSGQVITINSGPLGLWSGILQEPSYDDSVGWTYTAQGLFSLGEQGGYLCFDADGNTTSVPDVAVDEAIARGLPWSRPNSIDSSPFAITTTTNALNCVNDLLRAFADSVSKRVRVDALGVVDVHADPTTPDWYLMPGVGQLGLSEQDYASDLYLRYRDTATTYATVHVSDSLATIANHREQGVDATNLGVTDSGNVTNIGNGLMAKGAARYAWTQAINPSRLQLTTPGGTPAYLPSVRGGQMVRLLGVRNQQGQPLPYYDFVIGRTELVAGADTILLAPVQLAARTLVDVLALALAS
jgi:hypothetical protein